MPPSIVRLTPRPIVTIGLVVLACALYLWQGLQGESLTTIPVSALESMGGNLALLSLTGDGWRLLTNIFLHANLLHLVMNMYMLALVGPLAERWYGRVGMLCVYLLGGLWASYASAVWNASHLYDSNTLGSLMGFGPTLRLVVSVGASGALMALCGALLVAWLFAPRTDDASSALPKSTSTLVQVVAINLALGFFIQGIDQAAHVGGVVAGGIIGAAIGTLTAPIRGLRWSASAIVGAGLLGLLVHFSSWQDLTELRQERDEEIAAEKQELAERQAAKLQASYRKTGEQARQKANTQEAKELLVSLPPPVSEQEALGRVFRYPTRQPPDYERMRISDDEKTAEIFNRYERFPDHVFRIDLATGGAKRVEIKNGSWSQTTEESGSVLARNPKDGSVLTQMNPFNWNLVGSSYDERGMDSSYDKVLTLMNSSNDKVLKYWETCDTSNTGETYSINAAVFDPQGKALIASLGPIKEVRVTQLETGVDVALLPTVGYPRQVKFSRDGKQLYVLSDVPIRPDIDMGPVLERVLQVLDIGKRLPDERRKSANIVAPVICVWSDSIP
jgi:membrane associated rhomboid family serine protease